MSPSPTAVTKLKNVEGDVGQTLSVDAHTPEKTSNQPKINENACVGGPGGGETIEFLFFS